MSEFFRFAVFLLKYIHRSRKKRVILFSLFVMIICCEFLFFHEVQSGGVRQTLSVITYNVSTLHGTKVAFGEIVNAVEEGGAPDLLLLQEIPNEEMVVGIARSLGLGYHVYASYRAMEKDMAWPLFPQGRFLTLRCIT